MCLCVVCLVLCVAVVCCVLLFAVVFVVVAVGVAAAIVVAAGGLLFVAVFAVDGYCCRLCLAVVDNVA